MSCGGRSSSNRRLLEELRAQALHAALDGDHDPMDTSPVPVQLIGQRLLEDLGLALQRADQRLLPMEEVGMLAHHLRRLCGAWRSLVVSNLAGERRSG